MNPQQHVRLHRCEIALLASIFMANSAYAVQMNPDGCLPTKELMTQLQSEGQMSAVKADRVFPAAENRPARRSFVVFTTNSDGTRGYSFEGNQPSGTPSTSFCLSATFNSAKVLNANVAEVPPGIAPNSNLVPVLKFAAAKGFNPLFIGERSGAITVVVGQPGKSQLNGMILVGNNNAEVKAGDQGGLMNLDYSANFSRR